MNDRSDPQALYLQIADGTRSQDDPWAVVSVVCAALGDWLKVDRVLYAEVDETSDRATIHNDWTNGRAAHLPPELRVSDFGETLVAHPPDNRQSSRRNFDRY